MKGHSGEFPVKKMAQVLKVSRSRYYAWLTAPPSARRRWDEELGDLIQEIYEGNRCAYGSPRIFRDVKKLGIACSRKRIARIMSEKGLRGRVKRRFKATTDSMHEFPVAPNLLNREFSVALPNRVWVSDITYIRTMEGWLYLCIILDLYSRIATGWSMSNRLGKELALDALSMAVDHRKPPKDLIFHSDQGVQYASGAFRDRLKENKMIQSMSRKGDCWDNACAESFFATLKTEEVYHRVYRTREEARIYIFDYIAVFYNRKRSHSFLDYMSPEEYEFHNACTQNIA